MRFRSTPLVLASLLACAGAAPTAARAQFPEVTADDLLKLFTGKPKAIPIDTRSLAECEQARIVGALCIPTERMREEAARLPKDRKTPLVFYCRGPGWTLSRTSAVIAGDMGYLRLHVYQAGMPDWLARRYPIDTGRPR